MAERAISDFENLDLLLFIDVPPHIGNPQIVSTVERAAAQATAMPVNSGASTRLSLVRRDARLAGRAPPMSLITGAARSRTGSKRSSEYAERFADSDIHRSPASY